MKISVIGAGIGGLTTALTLKQKGIPVDIYEGAKQIKPAGAGIIIANNAMQVLKKLGVEKRLEQAGNRISSMKITTPSLKPLSVIDLTPFEKKYQVNTLAIHRMDIQKILAEETGRENIHLAKRLIKIEKDLSTNLYNLLFEDGETLQTEILIGADGLRSVVRNQLFRENALRDAHQICWRGICEAELPRKYTHELNEAWGKGKRFGFVKIDDKNTYYWYALVNQNTGIPETDLIHLFHNFHEDISTLISVTPKEGILKNPIKDLKPIYKWSNGNTCLLGDAAHATTPNMGQGACQAIEDAYVLGNLMDRDSTLSQLFKQYETLRRKKAHKVVNTSWKIGKLSQMENPAGIWLRNRLMKALPQSLNNKQMEWVFDID